MYNIWLSLAVAGVFALFLLGFVGYRLVRVIFWESVRHPREGTVVEIQGDKVRTKRLP